MKSIEYKDHFNFVQPRLHEGCIIHCRLNSRNTEIKKRTFLGYQYCKIGYKGDIDCKGCNGKIILKEETEPQCLSNQDGTFVVKIEMMDFIKIEEMEI